MSYIPFEGVSINLEMIYSLLSFKKKEIRYACFSLEEGEKCEHDHFHFYVELFKPQRFSFFQRLFGKKHHFEVCGGDQQANIEYISHTGLHADKPGKLLSKVFEWGKKVTDSQEESGIYDIAINRVLEGASLMEICKECGGGILPMLGNLSRLKAEIEAEKDKRKGIESNYAIVASLKEDVKFLNAVLDENYRERVTARSVIQ